MNYNWGHTGLGGAMCRTCNKMYGDAHKWSRMLDQLNMKRSVVSGYQSRLKY